MLHPAYNRGALVALTSLLQSFELLGILRQCTHGTVEVPEVNLPEPVLGSYPAPGVLLVRLNRPKDLNCINSAGHVELDQIWSWLDKEPNLSVGIITGTGRAFCAGADLKGKTTK